MSVVWKLSAIAMVLGLAACARGQETSTAMDASPAVQTGMNQQVDESLPPVMTYKSPTCGCCELWVEHMRAAGFRVEVENIQDMGAIKAEAGVPVGKGSCHTAKVGGYYVEGHVPANDVKRLLAEKPNARGLVAPGMVPGSPGMEQGGVTQPYDVLLMEADGTTSVFAHHGG